MSLIKAFEHPSFILGLLQVGYWLMPNTFPIQSIFPFTRHFLKNHPTQLSHPKTQGQEKKFLKYRKFPERKIEPRNTNSSKLLRNKLFYH